MEKKTEEVQCIEIQLTKKCCDFKTLKDILDALVNFNMKYRDKQQMKSLVISTRNKNGTNVNLDGGTKLILELQQQVDYIVDIIASVSHALELGNDTKLHADNTQNKHNENSQCEKELMKR